MIIFEIAPFEEVVDVISPAGVPTMLAHGRGGHRRSTRITAAHGCTANLQLMHRVQYLCVGCRLLHGLLDSAKKSVKQSHHSNKQTATQGLTLLPRLNATFCAPLAGDCQRGRGRDAVHQQPLWTQSISKRCGQPMQRSQGRTRSNMLECDARLCIDALQAPYHLSEGAKRVCARACAPQTRVPQTPQVLASPSVNPAIPNLQR